MLFTTYSDAVKAFLPTVQSWTTTRGRGFLGGWAEPVLRDLACAPTVLRK